MHNRLNNFLSGPRKVLVKHAPMNGVGKSLPKQTSQVSPQVRPRLSRNLATQSGSAEEQRRHLLRACLEGAISSLIPDILNYNLHCNKMPRWFICAFVCEKHLPGWLLGKRLTLAPSSTELGLCGGCPWKPFFKMRTRQVKGDDQWLFSYSEEAWCFKRNSKKAMLQKQTLKVPIVQALSICPRTEQRWCGWSPP